MELVETIETQSGGFSLWMNIQKLNDLPKSVKFVFCLIHTKTD